MQELKCPKCGAAIQLDDATFASIAEQVRNTIMNEEVERRAREIREKLLAEFKSEKATDEREHANRLTEKELALKERDAEIVRLKEQLAGIESVHMAELKTSKAESEQAQLKVIAEKDARIQELEGQIAGHDSRLSLAVLQEQQKGQEEINTMRIEISHLKDQVDVEKKNAVAQIATINEQHNALIREKEEQIQQLRDYKTRLSTKMIGESLEAHCENEFRMQQSLGLFPTADFHKDNQVLNGTKGDFVFRDCDASGEEYISIMFEMKNESDTTATKHKNEDFFDKLDKDRREKKCEYAVLVSMLEADSELYNRGIVDVSFRYPKMYVIRPQMFIPLISILCQNARRNSQLIADLRSELATAKAQSIDVTNFENKMNQFRNAFGGYVETHVKKQEAAIAGVDKIIAALEKQIEELRKVKSNFESSMTKLEKANDKLQTDFTVKKLTWGNKTMQQHFAEARKNSETPRLDGQEPQNNE